MTLSKDKPDPNKKSYFFVINKHSATRNQIQFKSESKLFQQSTDYNQVKINTHALCDADPNNPFEIVFYEFNKTGNHRKLLDLQVSTSMIIENGN